MALHPNLARCRLIAASVLTALLAAAAAAQRPLLGELRRMVPRCTDRTMCVAVGDVDADGDLDMLVGIDGWPWQNRLCLNDGTGRFEDVTTTNLPIDHEGALAAALADVDGDGDLDAFFGNRSQDELWLNDGTGVFVDVTAARLPANSATTTCAKFGDVDGDGDCDLVVGGSAQNRLYVNDGAGSFTDVTAARLPAVSDRTQDVELVDIDVDGDLDMVFANSLHGQDRLLVNDGSGTFTDETSMRMPVDVESTYSIAAGDVDGDGDVDLLLGIVDFPGPVPGQDRLYLNDGRGTFVDATAVGLPALQDATRDVALTDCDGDGDLDALIANSGQDLLLVNDGTGHFTVAAPTNLPVDPEITLALGPADLDGDGDADLLLVRSYGTSLWLNDGTARFADVTSSGLPRDTDSTLAIALADLDGDADIDMLCGNRYGSSLQPARLCLNDGTGRFADVSAAHLPADSFRVVAIAVGDVDGDSDVDALLVRDGPDLLFVNNGMAVFADESSTRLPPASDDSRGVALADVDGDGDLDALIANAGQQNRLYLNDGRGVFVDMTAIGLPQILDRSTALALADVEGDGDLDLLIGNEGEQNRLYLNDGRGVFTDVTAVRLPVDSDRNSSVAFGDVDGDGDPDVLLGNGQQDRLYLNDGTGSFTDATANLPTDGDDNNSVDLFDVDGDGDLDAFIGNWMRRNRLYLNDGTGTFLWGSHRVQPLWNDDTGDVAIGDLDEDGDLDVVVANAGEDQILTNLTRGLAWRATPRLSYTLTFDVHGQPGTAFVLDAAWNRARIPVPPYGVFGLDLASVLPVAVGTLDGLGHAEVVYTVPPDPSLQGLSVFWQAIVMQPLHLTNVEVTVFQAL